MADQYGNSIPAPGVYKGATFNDDELLVSTEGGFTQKGVTLKSGQGVLPLGTVLARETTSKKYVKFVSGGPNGTGTAVGVLRKTTDTSTDAAAPSFLANIVISGILNLTKVSSANGGTTAILTAFTGSRENTVLGTFTL